MSSLTPAEIIRLGMEQGQPADVILASLEAAGFKIVAAQSIDPSDYGLNSPNRHGLSVEEIDHAKYLLSLDKGRDAE